MKAMVKALAITTLLALSCNAMPHGLGLDANHILASELPSQMLSTVPATHNVTGLDGCIREHRNELGFLEAPHDRTPCDPYGCTPGCGECLHGFRCTGGHRSKKNSGSCRSETCSNGEDPGCFRDAEGKGTGCISRRQPLRAQPDGSFKILHITDQHFGEATSSGKFQDDTSIRTLKYFAEKEKPNLVVLGGDQLTSAGIFDAHKTIWGKIANVLSERGIPHTAVLGNHDTEPFGWNTEIFQGRPDITRRDLMKFDASTLGSYSGWAPPELEPAGSVFIVDVKGPIGDDTVKLQLIHMDSGGMCKRTSGLCLDKKDTGNPDMQQDIRSQLPWLEKELRQRRLDHGRPVPSLLFIHIPLTAFNSAFTSGDDSLVGTGKCVGVKGEQAMAIDVGDAQLLRLAKNYSEIKAIIVGHNHCNDFCCKYGDNNLNLCFGRRSGRGGYGCLAKKSPRTGIADRHFGWAEGDIKGHKLGARVITFNQRDDSFKTYLRIHNDDKDETYGEHSM